MHANHLGVAVVVMCMHIIVVRLIHISSAVR